MCLSALKFGPKVLEPGHCNRVSRVVGFAVLGFRVFRALLF